MKISKVKDIWDNLYPEIDFDIYTKGWEDSNYYNLFNSWWLEKDPKASLYQIVLVILFYHENFDTEVSDKIPWWKINRCMKDIYPDDLEVLYLMYISFLNLEESASSALHRLSNAGLMYPLPARSVPHVSSIADYMALTDDGIFLAGLMKDYNLVKC